MDAKNKMILEETIVEIPELSVEAKRTLDDILARKIPGYDGVTNLDVNSDPVFWAEEIGIPVDIAREIVAYTLAVESD